MFEHLRNRNPIFGLALDFMTLWMRLGGTGMNRNTPERERDRKERRLAARVVGHI